MRVHKIIRYYFFKCLSSSLILNYMHKMHISSCLFFKCIAESTSRMISTHHFRQTRYQLSATVYRCTFHEKCHMKKMWSCTLNCGSIFPLWSVSLQEPYSSRMKLNRTHSLSVSFAFVSLTRYTVPKLPFPSLCLMMYLLANSLWSGLTGWPHAGDSRNLGIFPSWIQCSQLPKYKGLELLGWIIFNRILLCATNN